MPVKVKTIDWNTALDAEIWQQSLLSVMQELEDMSGRDLYDLHTYSLCPRYLIDRPCNFAMHGTFTNYEIDSEQLMKTCLIDGSAFVKIGDWRHLDIEKYVIEVIYDGFTEELKEIWTDYVAEDTLHYTTMYAVGPPATQTNYKPQRTCEKARLEVDEVITLPYFPYVGFFWHNKTSFLDPVHEAVIRLEAAYRVVAVENIERKGMQLYLQGVRNVDDIKSAPRKLGRSVHILPDGATFHNPGSDAPGLELIKWEIVQLWEGLEKATGVVSTEKLASLSGVSRLIAEKPLLMLCEDIRNVYEKGMADVETACKGIAGAPPLEISFQPLHEIESPGAYLGWINEAYTKGVISEVEYIREFRRLLEMDSLNDESQVPATLLWKPEANPKEIPQNGNGQPGTNF
jgi:hypothetical protein